MSINKNNVNVIRMTTAILMPFIWFVLLFKFRPETVAIDFILTVFYLFLSLNTYKTDIKSMKQFKVPAIINALLFSFALVGNPALIYNEQISVKRVIYFVCIFVFCFHFSLCLLQWLERFELKEYSNKARGRGHYFVLLFISILAMEAIYLIALNPGIISWDAYYVIAEAKGLYPLQEYSGLFYVLINKVLLSIVDSVYFLEICQICYAAFVFSYVASYFANRFDKKVKGYFICAIVCAIVLLPNNSCMILTISKDVPWALSFFLYVFLLYELYVSQESQKGKLRINVLYVFAGVMVGLIRQNGWFVVPATIFASVLLMRRNKRIITLISSTLVIILIFEVAMRCSPYEETDKGRKYVAAFEDLEGVYVRNGEIAPKTKEMIESVVPPGIEGNYDPYWAYYEDWLAGLSEISVFDFCTNYIDTFLKNPILVTRMVFLRLDMMYDISLGINGKESWQWKTFMTYKEWDYLVPQRIPNVLTTIIDKGGVFSLKSPIKEILWRAGLAMQIVLFMCSYLTYKNRKNIILFLPFFSNIFFYIIALSWSHYRYYWCIELLALLYVFIFLDFKGKEYTNREVST